MPLQIPVSIATSYRGEGPLERRQSTVSPCGTPMA
jgi:hypothetical protein